MINNQKNFLVTGATGFLGRTLLEYLSNNYPDVKAIPLVRDRQSWDSQDWIKNLNYNQVVTDSLENAAKNPDSVGNIDGIFHLAAIVHHSRAHSEEVYTTNIEGTLNMVRLSAAKKCRMIYLSTSGTVGVFNSRTEWADEHSPYKEKEVAGWPYYDSKIKAERAARKLANELGVELIIVRPPMLLGPGDHRFRSTSNIIRYMRGALPFLLHGGMHFVDIRDASAALVKAMEHNKPQPVYHLSGVACSLDNFFKMVENASGVKPPSMHLPNPIALAVANTASGIAKLIPGGKSPLPDPVVVEMAGKYWDVRSRYAAQDLGFFNRNGQDTINDTVEWLINHHDKLKALKTS